MPPHRRPPVVPRLSPGARSAGSGTRHAPRWAGAAALLLGAVVLGAPGAADAASAQRQIAAARPAQASTTKASPAKAVSARATPARRVVRQTRPSRSADTAAYDDRAGAPATLPVAYGPVLAETGGSPRAACLAAARQAERTHGLPEGLMVAVALSESGLHAHALNIRGRAHFPADRAAARALVAGAGGRGYAGCVQISLGHARGSDWPLDPVQATDWAGSLMARAHAETGSWTAAVARFHGGSPAGSRRVICRVRAKLEAAAPGSPVLRDAACGGDAARERRNGATLLEIAEAQ